MKFSVEELKKEIELTGYKINKYCDFLLLGKNEHADKYVLVLSDAFSSVMPMIIGAYGELDCLKGEDGTIWKIQLERIYECLNSDDDMRKIDVLKFETVENLKILLGALRQYGE